MFKNILVLGVLIIAPGTTLANNFYLGGDVGGIALQDKLSTVEGTFDMGKFGFIGGGLGGYTYNVMNQLRLSLEGYIDGTSVTPNLIGSSNNVTNVSDRYMGGFVYYQATNFSQMPRLISLLVMFEGILIFQTRTTT